MRDRLYEANTPLAFPIVKDEGVAVGPPFEVIYPSFGQELMVHQAWGRMTDEVLLRGLDANAIQVSEFIRLDKNTGKHVIQPRRIIEYPDSPQVKIERELREFERVEAGLARVRQGRRLRTIFYAMVTLFFIGFVAYCSAWAYAPDGPWPVLSTWIWGTAAFVTVRISFRRPDLFS